MTYTQVWNPATNAPSIAVIQRDEDGAFIPADPDNIDYQEYLAWYEEGNEPKAATPPAVTLPETIPVEDRVGDLETRVDQIEMDLGR
jgi:hypothetical protein